MYDAFADMTNRTKMYCIGKPNSRWDQSGRTRPYCFQGAGCKDWANWWDTGRERCWSEVPVFTAKAMNMVIVDDHGGDIGCYNLAKMTAGFVANFDFEDNPRGGDPKRVPRFGGMPVTASHFNGGCKALLCSAPLCANIWAGEGRLALNAHDLEALISCCPPPPVASGKPMASR